MSEPRYARDMTRVMRHKGKLWNISDFSLAGVGGISLQAGVISFVVGLVAGVGVGAILAVAFGLPFGLVFLAVTAVVIVGVYFVLSRNAGGKDQPLDRLLIWSAGRIRDPGIVRGAGRDRQPYRLHWTAILWRPEWANVDTSRQPRRRQYNPQPVGDDSFAVVVPKPSTTFNDLLQ